jgi:hypothetical protein
MLVHLSPVRKDFTAIDRYRVKTRLVIDAVSVECLGKKTGRSEGQPLAYSRMSWLRTQVIHQRGNLDNLGKQYNAGYCITLYTRNSSQSRSVKTSTQSTNILPP